MVRDPAWVGQGERLVRDVGQTTSAGVSSRGSMCDAADEARGGSVPGDSCDHPSREGR